MSLIQINDTDLTSSIITKIIQTNERISDFAKTHLGVSLTSLPSREPVLKQLNPAILERVLQLLQQFLDFVSQAQELSPMEQSSVEKSYEWDEIGGITQTLKLSNLHCSENLTKYFQRGDSVEIYDADNFQIYRNLNFMRTSGYSVLDILLGNWHHLWTRPRKVQEQMFAAITEAVKDPDKVIKSSIDPHFVRETYDPRVARILEIEFKYLIPLKNLNRQFGGFIVTSGAKVVDKSIAARDFHFI